MKRRHVLLGAGTATTAALAGCLGSADEGDDDGGDGSASDSSRTITVSNAGEVTADPDLARLQVGVEATGDEADEVRDDLAMRSDELYDALVAFGIDEEDITTGQFRIRDRVDERRIEEAGVDPQSEDDLEAYRYYEGTHSLSVDVHAVEDTGDVIDTAVDAGADGIGRIEFTLSDEKRDALRKDALEDAIDGARNEADFVAANVDASVVEATRIDTSGGGVSPVYERAEMDDVADDGAPSTELHPDDVTVSATVEIVYEIE